MKINLFVNDNLNNSNIVGFCKQSKKFQFVFQDLSNIESFYDQRKLLILKETSLINDFKKKLKKHSLVFFKTTCFLLPKKYDKNNLNINANIINFPVKFSDLENMLQILFKNMKNTFKNLELRKDGYLYNINNHKQTHLTEIESEIILLLFKNKNVEKSSLNSKVLNQSPLIDSKSLDSHLYRLRKKLISVDHTKKIVLVKNNSLQIV